MKIRTDFVTNSSSSGYIYICVEFRDQTVTSFDWVYDSGYGGYFWQGYNKNSLERSIMSMKSGKELLNLLRSSIDSFDEMISSNPEEGLEFTDRLKQLDSIANVKSVHIEENTNYNMGGSDGCEFDYTFLTLSDIEKESLKAKKKLKSLETRRVFLYGTFEKKQEYIKSIKDAGGTIRTDDQDRNIDLIIISDSSLHAGALQDPWLIQAYQDHQKNKKPQIITESDFAECKIAVPKAEEEMPAALPKKAFDCVFPFIPVDGQGFGEDCIVYKDIILSYFDDLSWELFYYRAFVAMIIDSDHPKKNELLADLFTYGFFNQYASSLGEKKHPGGFKKAVSQNERYIWFDQFLRIAFLLNLSNDEMFQKCAKSCLGNLSAYIGKDKQDYEIPSGFSSGSIKKVLTAYMDAIPEAEELIKSVFFKGKVKSGQLASTLLELALDKYSTDDIVRYYCGAFHISESQFQIRQFGAEEIDSPDARFTLLKNPYGEITIFNYIGDDTCISIPDRINDNPVTAIFSYAFATEAKYCSYPGNQEPISYRKSTDFNKHTADNIDNCKRIEELHIPESIREIGAEAFDGGLSNLKELRIPDSVTSLPTISEFQALEKLILPKKAYRFTSSMWCIYHCPKLEHLTIPDGVEYLSIDSCNKLKYINIPESLNRIDQLRNCQAVQALYLPIERFEQNAFQGCESLKEVYFPNLEYGFKNGFEESRIPELVIHGYKKSYAEKFAKRIRATFIPDCTPESKQKLDEKYCDVSDE